MYNCDDLGQPGTMNLVVITIAKKGDVQFSSMWLLLCHVESNNEQVAAVQWY